MDQILFMEWFVDVCHHLSLYTVGKEAQFLYGAYVVHLVWIYGCRRRIRDVTTMFASLKKSIGR